jgi:predicted porin
MKKSLLALAALTAFAGVASAQSSVTLFGVVDMSVRNVTNGKTGSETTLAQDGIASSRLGFRGVEDLGGGMRAGFWLEAGVNPDVGGTNTAAATSVNSAATAATPPISQFFNRRSTLSLMGGFGEIRLGRDYTPDFWNHTIFDPFGTNGVGSSVNIFGALNGSAALVRSNNTVGYLLPGGLGGLYGQVQVGIDESVQSNDHVGARIGYAAGPVNFAVSYGKTNTSIEWERINVGGSFRAGPATIFLQYNSGDGGRTGKIDHIMVGATAGFGQSTLKFTYGKSDGKGALSRRDADMIAVGYQYDLSKRSALYATGAQINNKGTAQYAIGGGRSAGFRAGEKSTGYEFGVRHTF